MAREVMTTADVMDHFQCTARVAREYMKEIGIIRIGHGYIYRDALERYEASKMEETKYTLPIMQEDYNPKRPRYQRIKKGS